MLSKWVISPTYKWDILGHITHLLSIDPNFQRDIQVGHIESTPGISSRVGSVVQSLLGFACS